MNGTGTQPVAVRAAVEKITASQAFRGLDRLNQFLRFVVQEALEGRADQVKEYVIGVEVYRKDSGAYDPRTDSTVRVEATKLRARLKQYYETEGQADAVVISIPKGSYSPAFEARPGVRAWPSGPRRVWAAVVVGALLVAAAALLWRESRPVAWPAAVARLTPLTSFQGNELRPSLSPDGRQVAFSWNGAAQGNYDLYIMTIGDGHPLRLTATAEPVEAQAWSPDGRTIAFFRGGAVFLISPTGGQERRVAKAKDAALAWLPDGRYLALSGTHPQRAAAGIVLVSITTGEKRWLTSPPEKSLGDTQPAVSPDGKTLAFVRRVSAGSRLCVASVAVSEPRCRPAENEIAGISWTGDSRELVFSSPRGSVHQLWRIPAGRGFLGEPQLVAGAGENAYYPVIVGNRLAYQRLLCDLNIWRMETATAAGRSNATRVVGSTRWDIRPQPSPDGSRIAFVSDRTGEYEIWMCDREANSFVQLTSFRGPAIGSPRWSPDGTKIAFHAVIGGNSGIYLVGLDAISLRRVTSEDATAAAPSWSSDGRTLYFRSDRSGADQIWKMPADGGAAVQVTRRGGFEAMESADGEWLYFVKSAEQPGLWRMPVGASSGEEKLLLDGVRDGFWATTAQGIYWVHFTPGNTGGEIRSLDTRANRAAVVGRIEKAILIAAPGLSATRDGKWILYSQADQFDADLILLEPFH